MACAIHPKETHTETHTNTYRKGIVGLQLALILVGSAYNVHCTVQYIKPIPPQFRLDAYHYANAVSGPLYSSSSSSTSAMDSTIRFPFLPTRSPIVPSEAGS